MTSKNKWYKRFGWMGIALCGLCCALPIMGTAIGMASLTALSFYLEKIGILAFGLSAFFFWYAGYSKKKKEKACKTSCDDNCNCKSDTTTQSA
jgi:hypothetical protein